MEIVQKNMSYVVIGGSPVNKSLESCEVSMRVLEPGPYRKVLNVMKRDRFVYSYTVTVFFFFFILSFEVI